MTRFAVIPDERRLMLGIDKSNLFQAGFVYEAFEIMGEIIIRKIGEYSLPKKGCPSEHSDASTQIYSGMHLYTKQELEKIISSRPEND